jgi:hypothetical protein
MSERCDCCGEFEHLKRIDALVDVLKSKAANPAVSAEFFTAASVQTREERSMSEEWVPFDKRNAAMLSAVGFSITDEPGHGESACVEGEMAVYVVQLANGRLRLSIDLPDGRVINADIVDLHEELIAAAGTE